MPNTQVSTSATTTSAPRSPLTTPGLDVRYTTAKSQQGSSYTVKPHPPTPRAE